MFAAFGKGTAPTHHRTQCQVYQHTPDVQTTSSSVPSPQWTHEIALEKLGALVCGVVVKSPPYSYRYKNSCNVAVLPHTHKHTQTPFSSRLEAAEARPKRPSISSHPRFQPGRQPTPVPRLSRCSTRRRPNRPPSWPPHPSAPPSNPPATMRSAHARRPTGADAGPASASNPAATASNHGAANASYVTPG